jgi:excisionase family DNA binding protein
MKQNEQPSVHSEIRTVSEMAAYFGRNPETIKRQAHNGKLPGFKLGKTWFFRMCDIDNMINAAVGAAH